MEVLQPDEWRGRAAAHAARVDALVAAHLERRSAHAKHPVHDFLFTYYSHRPAQLRRWHPGAGVGLAGGSDLADAKGYAVTDGVAHVAPAYVAAQRPLLEALRRLLAATAARPPQLSCFGLHEWAMVYRLGEDQTRHADWPLRLGAAGTDRVVESHRITCTHFDAYRFFTGPARPLNRVTPRRDDRAEHEQPGCLHAMMDLYGKLAVRLTPMIPSELVADAFELAWDIRILDMRASPYDLSNLGYSPVKIETPEGKREYVDAQRAFMERGAPIRQQLISECERLLAVARPD